MDIHSPQNAILPWVKELTRVSRRLGPGLSSELAATPIPPVYHVRQRFPRPLIEDDSVRSQASLIFNARVGYRFDNGLKVQLDALNLLNAQTNQIEYYYLSRLPGEPIGGVADRHVHPAEPLAVRLTLAARF